MAGKTKTMEQIRNILQQKINGASIRAITGSTGVSRNTIRTYLRAIEGKGLSVKTALELDDQGLAQMLFEPERPPSSTDNYIALENKLSEYAGELKKRHVTRWLLWEEYRQEFPDGYGYTRFCHYLNNHIGQKDVTAIFRHQPAEKLMVDFAGDKLSYIDKASGEVIYCEVLITALPFSSYIYAEALPSQKQEDFVNGLTNAFLYLEGVPQSVLCDNLKSAVKKANRYEPSFTELIEQLSLHYQVTFLATRVRRPRDKATVETSVNVAYKRIYAKLRDTQCYNIKELNGLIRIELEALNQRNFKGRDYSRKDAFLQYEQSHLKPLPTRIFEVKKRVPAKVQRNYHIILGEDMHQYSVPWRYAGKQVNAVYTTDVVEIYHEHNRIAIHQRNYRRHGYSTSKEHMPDNHQAVMEQKGWDANYFLREAAKAGFNVRKAIAQILESKSFPEQTYNSCLGVLRLGNKYGKERLEAACTLMLQGPRINYGILDNILKNNMDKQLNSTANKDFKTPDHDNVRGPDNFNH
jgi:transposase